MQSIAVVMVTVTYTVSLEPTHCLAGKNSLDLENDSDAQKFSGLVDALFVHWTSALQSSSIDKEASSSGNESSLLSSELTSSPLFSDCSKDFPSINKWISWECLVSSNKATLLTHRRAG